MNKSMIGAALAVIACGCVSVRQNDGGSSCREPLIARDIVHEKFEVANNVVSAQDQMNCLFGFICWGSSATHIADAVSAPQLAFLDVASRAKNGAYANACDAARCDQIVGARYRVTVEDYFVFKKILAEVSGYPASLSGVEVIENKVPCCQK